MIKTGKQGRMLKKAVVAYSKILPLVFVWRERERDLKDGGR